MEQKHRGLVYLFLLLFIGCVDINSDGDFRSRVFTSTNGENIYINTLNWGVTYDKQFTVLTKDPNELRKREDSLFAIKGLEPFVYRFENDTLQIISLEKINIHETFQTIKIKFSVLGNIEYGRIQDSIRQGRSKYRLLSNY
ncbi:hypothetical protein SAMN04488018_12232 [Myroides marinus]|uniref:Uncharacterized protein n=1 Tax=Myroides marinus TaxID=703342 RepID=A0A1H6XWY9_9FLAO|nr:hypothetical protein [Myroides marinus]SEJ29402.1 hypothetical protein SAMN04488018_12232 [Myroides marinus]